MNKNLNQSRGTQLDPQQLESKIPNRYSLVLQAAHRARQIKRGGTSKYSVDATSDSASVTALLEIQNDW